MVAFEDAERVRSIARATLRNLHSLPLWLVHANQEELGGKQAKIINACLEGFRSSSCNG